MAVDSKIVSSIGRGLLVFLGVEPEDGAEEVEYLVRKAAQMRIFEDEGGVMNRSVMDIEGEILVISQFTLLAKTAKGNRPSYIGAARPEIAIPLYEKFISEMRSFTSLKVGQGVFGADMKVALVNDGPVTIWVDTKNKL